MTITRLGSNPKLAAGWDAAFGGKKASKTAAPKAPEKKSAAAKSSAKKAPAKKAKGKK